MCFFYLLHQLGWGAELTAGKRNCRVFLFGVLLYAGLVIITKNLQMQGYLTGIWDTLRAIGLVVLSADICTMGYLYRYHYGRSIMAEVAPSRDHDWIWDTKQKKYRKISFEEQKERDFQQLQVSERYRLKEKQHLRELEQQQALLATQREASDRFERLIARKREYQSARRIQRWWRDYLYRPGTGKWYLDVSRDFNQRARTLMTEN